MWTRLQLERCGLAASCLGLPDFEPYLRHGSVAFTPMAPAVNSAASHTIISLYICSLPMGGGNSLMEEPLLPILSRHRILS